MFASENQKIIGRWQWKGICSLLSSPKSLLKLKKNPQENIPVFFRELFIFFKLTKFYWLTVDLSIPLGSAPEKNSNLI